MPTAHTYTSSGMADRSVHPLLFWLVFILAGIWAQRFAPGVDCLAPALIVCLQQRRASATFWLAAAFIVLQEGMGSLAFGFLILWYAGLLLLYLVGRWLFESRNLLFIFIIGAFLGVWRFFLVRMMASLQDMVADQDRLALECALQAVLFTLEWGLLFFIYKRCVRHDDEPRA
ncbi:MAG: hypothetical protein AB1916_11085 [Thermodesulfobacteriota bacterium]